jgi:hypothetical protein
VSAGAWVIPTVWGVAAVVLAVGGLFVAQDDWYLRGPVNQGLHVRARRCWHWPVAIVAFSHAVGIAMHWGADIEPQPGVVFGVLSLQAIAIGVSCWAKLLSVAQWADEQDNQRRLVELAHVRKPDRTLEHWEPTAKVRRVVSWTRPDGSRMYREPPDAA